MSVKKTKSRADASEKVATPWGERILARLAGRPVAQLAQMAGINTTSLRDAIFRVTPGAETAVKIAQALDVSVEWLITGKESRPRQSVRSADDADWVDLPRYNLYAFTPESKPEPEEVIPIRRDWLYSHVRRSKRLWLAELPTDRFPQLGREGDLMLCEDVEEREPIGYYLYFYDGKPMVRYRGPIDPEDQRRIDTGQVVVFHDNPGLRLAARILGTFGLKPA